MSVLIVCMRNVLIASILLIFLSGCNNMKLENFADKQPTLKIEEYFLGKTTAMAVVLPKKYSSILSVGCLSAKFSSFILLHPLRNINKILAINTFLIHTINTLIDESRSLTDLIYLLIKSI